MRAALRDRMIARRLLLMVALSVSTPLAGATAVRVISRDADACTRGIVRAEPVCDGCSVQAQSASWTARDGVADVQLALGGEVSRWRVQAVAEQCWSAAVLFEGGDALSLSILPTARLAATVAPPRGDRAPEALQFRVSSVRDGEFPEAVVECARSKGRWLCEVPATELDLRLSVDGFAPHYVWGLRPQHGLTSDLGSIQLRRGASISGRAAVAARNDAGPIAVTLSPEAYSDPAAKGLRTLETTTNARGFFQFSGIEPGQWTISATRPGWSTATTRVAVTERGEAALPSPLVLEPLAALEIVLDPPRDAGGADWNVALERSLDSAGRVRIAAAPSVDGTWKADQLERGMYIVTVTSADGAVVHRRGDTVYAGMAPLRITIDVMTVRGTVTAGGEPLAARLDFSHRLGKSARMTSAEDGTFSGVLPVETPSRWNVKVRPKGSAASVVVNNVAVDPVDGAARLELELPNGRLTGVVVDEAGQPVAATVRVRHQDFVVSDVPTASDGTFSVGGIPTGEVELQAWTRAGRDSGYIAYHVKGADDEPITIVAPQRLRVQAQVVTPGGRPYAGAVVRVMRSGRTIVDEVTSPAGRFPIHSPASDPVAHAIVIAPGYGVTMRTIPLTGDEESRRIVLSPTFGQVWVPTGDQWDDWPVIAANGMLPVGLYSWLEPFPSVASRPVRGGRIINLEPGHYRFCRDLSMQGCVTHTVTAGSQHSIEFPK